MGATLNDQPSRPMTEADIAAAGDLRYQRLSAPYSNIVVNGGMEVSQENVTTQVTLASGTAKYAVDMFYGQYVHAAATAVFKTQQLAPSNSPSFGLGFPLSLQLIATTLSAMAGAGDYAHIQTPIEGYRIVKLGFGSATNPQSFTVSFWVCATVTGTATVSIRNSAANRSYLANFTVNAANTWEYKTVTIPVDTTGTWLVSNGIGLQLGFCFGAGSTFQGTNNAWSAGNFLGTSSTTNFFASNNNNVNITGVGVWPGTSAPSAALSPFAQRPFSEEIMLCQRYFEKSALYSTPVKSANDANYVRSVSVASVASGAYYASVPMKVRKRVAPTVTIYPYTTPSNTGRISNDVGGDYAASSASATSISETDFSILNQSGAALTIAAAQIVIFGWYADARL